jgi:biopolymer transport protein ExbD
MSAFLRNKRKEMEDDGEPNLVPIMNMFLVIIPFLLMSASFYQIKAVKTSIPILSSGIEKPGEAAFISLTVVAEIKKESIKLSAMSDKLTDKELEQFKTEYPLDNDSIYPMDKFSMHLQGIKIKYPKSDTLILIPDSSIDYDTIIRAMDTARKSGEITLFPNVVLSGSVG